MYKVLHVIPDFGPGGAERMAVNLMTNLDPGKFSVSAVSFFDPGAIDLGETLTRAGVRVTYLHKKIGFDPRIFLRFHRVLADERPDIVHTHRHVMYYTLPSVLLHRVPALVHTVHTLAEREVGRLGRVAHSIAFRAGVVPVSIAGEVGLSLARTYGLKQFPTIANGIPVQRYRNPTVARAEWRRREGFGPDQLLCVSIARLSPEKNHAMLLRAFATGLSQRPGSHLLLVGVGPLRSDLAELARAVGIGDRVHFLGFRTDIPEILAAADLFVLASTAEGNPLAVMEAMAAGRAVVCTAVGGVPELVCHGSTGCLVPPGDEAGLARTLALLEQNRESMHAYGRAAALEAERRFDVSLMVRAYEQLYEGLMKDRHRRRRG